MKTTLLLDADILAFKIASTSQRKFDFGDDDGSAIQVDEWADVVPRIHTMIEDLQNTLGTDDVVVCLSCPTSENWRLEILPSYKGQRDYSNRPVHLAAVKDYMEANWPSYRRPTLEADDIMGILSTSPALYPGKKIIVSEDKDMATIPGWLFNPAKHGRPKLITPEFADRWHLYQSIVGDNVDNYKGCPGAGPEKAELVLDGGHYVPYIHTFKSGPRKGLGERRWVLDTDSTASTWERVVALYDKYGFTEADALVQAQVSRICRASDYDFKNKKVIPWQPAKSGSPRPSAARTA